MNYGYIEYAMSIGHPNEDGQQAVGYMNLK